MNRADLALRAYYWLTPVFALADLAGIDIRVAALEGHRGWRMAYYALCMLVAVVAWRRPAFAAPAAILESSTNILLLILGFLAPLYALPGAVEGGGPVAPPVTAGRVVNFLLAGGIAVTAFHAQVAALKHRPS